MEVRKIDIPFVVRATKDGAQEFVISTEEVDRHGTVLKGWKLDNFMRNPIMAYQHDTHSSDPDSIIGSWDIRIEGTTLVGVPHYEPEDINPKAEKIRRKVEHGTLRAVSVGFYPETVRWGERKNGEDPEALYLLDNELLEVSIVAVPSNPSALKRSFEDIKKPEEMPDKKEGLQRARKMFYSQKLKTK